VDTRIKMVWAGGEEMAPSPPENPRWSTPMPQPNDLSRCLTALDQDSTLIAIIEMSQASWLVGAIVPGIERHPLKKLAPDAEELLQVLQRWGREAAKAGRAVKRIAVAFEASRDGFWLARWLSARVSPVGKCQVRTTSISDMLPPGLRGVSGKSVHRPRLTARVAKALIHRQRGRRRRWKHARSAGPGSQCRCSGSDAGRSAA
jgi:hypothetical protein